MKINVTIDLDDLWTDESSISEEISMEIKRKVLEEIWNKLKPAVEDQITRVTKNEVEKMYCRKINTFIDEFFETGELKSPKNSNEKMTLKEYILYLIQNNTNWNSPNENIKKLAQKFGEEMKNRYDLLFASQLVAKMNENGLLKEDVVKKLLDN